jgi:N-acylneuraminate cytidylyltransferase
MAGCEVPFVRPAELATGEARSIDVVRHALEVLPETYDLLVLLQPTSPLRLAADIDAAVRLCVESGAPACVSLTPADKPPQWMHALSEHQTLQPVLPDYDQASRRQGLPPAYAINGAVYVARTDWIRGQENFVGPETVGYIMPRERSIDIDEELDLVLAEALESWSRGHSDSAEIARRRLHGI